GISLAHPHPVEQDDQPTAPIRASGHDEGLIFVRLVSGCNSCPSCCALIWMKWYFGPGLGPDNTLVEAWVKLACGADCDKKPYLFTPILVPLPDSPWRTESAPEGSPDWVFSHWRPNEVGIHLAAICGLCMIGWCSFRSSGVILIPRVIEHETPAWNEARERM